VGTGSGMVGIDTTSLSAAFQVFTQGVATIASVFGTLGAVAQAWSSMTMTHQVNVNGQLNIGGIDDKKLVAAIQEGIGKFVGAEVIKALQLQAKQYNAGGERPPGP